MPNFCRNPGEKEGEYIYRICSSKDLIGSWEDVARVINKELGYDYSECKYRKDFNTFNRIFDENKDRFNGDGYLNSILEEKEKLKKERYRLQTEKLEYNRWLRENARDELIVEKIIDSISHLEKLDIPERINGNNPRNKEFVLMFGDEHFGSEFEIRGLKGEIINSYSPEVFYQRMWKLLDETIEIIKKEGIKNLHVFSLGDFADGVLRIGQLMKLRYGVVDSTVAYMEFISNWLNELTRFVDVKFYMCDGNHTEIRMFNQPKGSFKDENMGKIIYAYIRERLRGNDNFEIVKSASGNIFVNIAGYNVMGIHGEQKDMAKALKDFTAMYNVQIDYLVGGHLHHGYFESVGIDKGVIRVPSIVGVDEFAISLNKSNAPGASLICFEEGHGKKIEYLIDLK